ncbi:uncharacterized protein N7477_006671 [Penicillium maclennaniae]|uniref:uncharacterized protein n=1 Tax=Penicillium maclennaniae TaxID=1343394 RepID=UPI00253FC033|nr:uncharacterized protein N7477_006671 [Penicillium maclennaniae]KAJ5668101.1 hypothetical protein N7477_006671 [Penicillium maclennaniae]
MRLNCLIILCLAPLVLADDWDDFTNNLATDLAPLITLFGERLTKQFLSESISLIDNLIFALSPLGVLTTVVSVIRVCGGSSLRAFIGRAQEGPAEAESELLPCVSESTAELFNDGGISRVFGRPKVLEVVAWEDETVEDGKLSLKLGTLLDAVKSGAWSEKGKEKCSPDRYYLPEIGVPNLSLNKGIKRKDQSWSYCVAIVGSLLQTGVIVYSIITVFVSPDTFKKNGSAVPSYAFPFYIIGTTFLFIGMFFSAVIIERSSKEYYFKPKKSSTLYWLQPGNQKVGDQVFGSFLAEDTAPVMYIKSIRDHRYEGQCFVIYSTISLTVIGFIMQFIGLRGLHASVILASLGATLVMSILRTCLRTKRMAPEENKLKDEREITAYKQQELDCFAFKLEHMVSFDLISQDHCNTASVGSCLEQRRDSELIAKRLIQTRVRLAELTSGSHDGSTMAWDEMPIRSAAKNLARTIETTMDVMSSWGIEFGESFNFPLDVECQRVSGTLSRTTCLVQPSRSGDTLRWCVESKYLEAILGLWTWSLYKSEQDWLQPLYRLVGVDEAEAQGEAAYHNFHKWIFRQTEARMASLKLIDSSRRLFGCDADQFAHGNDIMVMRTENDLEYMAAQDIYVHFIKAAFDHLTNLGGSFDVNVGLMGSYVAESSRINELVGCFESCRLGSREDALLCMVPMLNRKSMLPALAADSIHIRKRTGRSINENDWATAFRLVEWTCQRSIEDSYTYSLYELGYLCRRALLSNKKDSQLLGFIYTCKILESETQIGFLQTPIMSLSSTWQESGVNTTLWHSFSKQIGWMAWHISQRVPGMEWMQKDLERLNVQQDLGLCEVARLHKEQALVGVHAMQELLTFNQLDRQNELAKPEDALGYWWASESGFDALVYSVLAQWAESGAENSSSVQYAFTIAAKCHSHWGIQVLQRRNADIDALNGVGRSSLMEVVDIGDIEAARTLLANGANPNGNDKVPGMRPLIIAAQRGWTSMVELLLSNRAATEVLDSLGCSALYCATIENHVEVVRLLLSHGANANKQAGGSSALSSAVACNRVELVRMLLEYGADVDTTTASTGSTPLTRAAQSGNAGMTRLLLENGANIHVLDGEGLTALDWAQRCGCESTVAILEAAVGNSV